MTLATVPHVTIAAIDIYAQKSPADTAAFIVSRDLITSEALEVAFASKNVGTGKDGDYAFQASEGGEIKGGKVTIPAHQRSATIIVQAKSTPAGRIALKLNSGPGYTASPDAAEIEIIPSK
jgi:hypothetical protein